MNRSSENAREIFIGRHRSQLETPAFCLDLTAWETCLSEHSQLWSRAGKSWIPAGQELAIPEIGQQVMNAGAAGFDCDNIRLAQDCSATCNAPLNLSEILVGPPALARLSELACRASVTLISDHYAQAEAYSEIGVMLDNPLPVLMEINLGLDQCGVRPGVDARDLAQGLRRLPGIELVGLSGTLGNLQTAQTDRSQWLDSRVTLLTSLLNEIPDQPAPRVSLSASGAVSRLALLAGVTEVRPGSLLAPADLHQQPGSLSVTATVISRAKLERAILNVGRVHCGGFLPTTGPFETASGRPLPDAIVAHQSDFTTTLTLGPQSLDIIIGDAIVVPVLNATMALRQHATLYGLRSAVVQTQWDLR